MGRILRRSLLPRALSLVVPLIVALLMAPLAHGQTAPAEPVVQSQTVVDILHQFSDKADVIFAGQVLAIRRPNGGVVEVEFRVDQAIRGCTAGTLTYFASGLGSGRVTINATASASVC